MLPLRLSRRAEKSLAKLPAKHFEQIRRRLLALPGEPRPHDSRTLRGHPYWRLDVGEYRVVYEINPDCIAVLLVGKRNDDEVYRELARILGKG